MKMINMGRKTIVIMIFIIISISICSADYFLNYYKESKELKNDTSVDGYLNLSNQSLPPLQVLGEQNIGRVVKIGPYGNNKSHTKVAYIIGVHSMEKNSHKAIFNMLLQNQQNLSHCYYLYIVSAKEQKDYNKSRKDGQILANKYAVKDINKNQFNLAVDIHSNRGYYAEKVFIFSALPDDKSVEIANLLVNAIPWMIYYIPPRSNEPTSCPYISEPLIKNGTPTLVYETFSNESFNLTEKRAHEFIMTLDKLNF